MSSYLSVNAIIYYLLLHLYIQNTKLLPLKGNGVKSVSCQGGRLRSRSVSCFIRVFYTAGLKCYIIFSFYFAGKMGNRCTALNFLC